MHLTQEAVRGLAHGARIALDDAEVEVMTRDLNSILDNLELITHYDLEGVEPTFHPIAGLRNVMREDVQEPGFSQEEALANAPSSEDGQFKIPPILPEAGGNR